MAKRIFCMACLVLAAVFLCLHMAAPDADAARMGGGKSFGGKSSYSKTAPAPRAAQQQQGTSVNRQNQAQTAGAAGTGMMGSGFRGMMGGLLAGSLLGALFFGGPHSGFGIMDMVLVALLAFMALKVIRMIMARRAPAEVVGGGNAPPENFSPRPDPWKAMDDASGGGSSSGAAAGGPDIRLDGFDQDDFLRGAKMVYVRLQEAWDKRDVEDIAAFATPAILNEVKEQAEADPNPSKTEIMLVNASLVSAERDGDDEVATVFFDVLLRENPDAKVPGQVRELWHFIRPAGSTQSWRLDGIQQVE